jgi:hypothetical protein
MATGESVQLASVDLRVPGSSRHGRAFFPAGELTHFNVPELASQLARCFIEDDDGQRLELLGQALTQNAVTVEVYRGESAPHELHAYFHAPAVSSSPIFACVLAPKAVVEHLVATPPGIVFETAALQVIDADPTSAAIVAAIEAWMRRIWPDAQQLPTVSLSPWPGPVVSEQSTFEILRLFPSDDLETDGSGSPEFSPRSDLVAPEFSHEGEAA